MRQHLWEASEVRSNGYGECRGEDSANTMLV